MRNGVRALPVVLFAILLTAACDRKPAPPSDPATRETVWAAIQPHAERYRIDPAFIYAIVAAESNFDPRACHGEARGLLQLKPAAWREVSLTPYAPAVWDWRQNLATGIDYLAWCRSRLHKKGKFSYPLLLASFHYGMDYVEQRGFDPGRIAVPDSPLYRELWHGNLTPVPPPNVQIPR